MSSTAATGRGVTAPAGVEIVDMPAASKRSARLHRRAQAAGQTAAQGWRGEHTPDTSPAPPKTPQGAGEDLVVEPGGTLVDAHVARAPHERQEGRLEVIPSWMRDGSYLAHTARDGAARTVHSVAYHLVRVPLYWLRLAARSPIGAARLLVAWVGWVSDRDGRTVRRHLSGAAQVGSPEAAAFARIQAQHRETMQTRAIVSLIAAAAALLAFLAGYWRAGDARPVLAAVAAVAVLSWLGWVGRGLETVIASRSTTDVGIPRLTSDLVITALESLGIAELNKAQRAGDGNGVRFTSPIHRDGPGWRADIDLPPGVTATDIIERRDRLASGLRRPEGCVWPEVDQDAHAGRLILWVGDRALSSAKPEAWPLARAGRVNLFDPFPFGVDQRGRPVPITLMFASMVIGAIPRMGKTAALRLLLLGAALDPRCELHVHNLKGGADLEPLAAVAHYCRSGDEPEDVDALMADLRAVHADMRRRYKTLKELPRSVCPDAKVSDELAAKRDLGLHPIVVGIDECQVLFEHATHKSEATDLVTDLVKRGPAVAIMVLVATQRPDKDSLPTGIRANAVLRLCLKVTGQTENDMVLGTSAYKSGVRATMFGRRDLGVAYLAGEGDDPVIVRAAYVDTVTAETIAARARQARLAAGLLSGMAAGEIPADDDSRSILDHLLEVWPAGETRVWWEDLARLLADRLPATYSGTDAEAVSAAARSHGLGAVQIARTVDGARVNRRGLDVAALRQALGDRDAA